MPIMSFSCDVWTPNIEGTFIAGEGEGAESGAFFNDGYKYGGATSTWKNVQVRHFIASRDCNLYSGSDIQVPALQVLACIKV